MQGEIDKLSKSLNEAEDNVRTFSNNLEAYEKSLPTNGTSLIRIFSDWKIVPKMHLPYRKTVLS